jgi:hypothetical protein
MMCGVTVPFLNRLAGSLLETEHVRRSFKARDLPLDHISTDRQPAERLDQLLGGGKVHRQSARRGPASKARRPLAGTGRRTEVGQ